jgi:hypothetical protein
VNRVRPFAVALTAGCGLLAACGSAAAPSPTGTVTARPTATALAGGSVSTAMFSTAVPRAWNNRTTDAVEVAKVGGNGRVEFLIEQAPPGQPKPNVNDVTASIEVLLLSPAVPDDQVVTYLQSISNNGATNLSIPQPFTIDGATGQFITYDRDIQGTAGESQELMVNHAGQTFDIILNTSQFAFRQQQAGLQAVLAAWRWRS